MDQGAAAPAPRRKSFLVLFFKKERLSFFFLIALAGFFLLHAFALPIYLFFTAIPDGVPKPTPFPDSWAILQAGACWRRGVDVYRVNACMAGGVFNYSPVLLRLGYFGLSGSQAIWLGLGQAVAFAVALAFLPRGRVAAAVFSPTVYYAVEQGNLDVAMCAVAIAGVGLIHRRRWVAYALFGLAAVVKFYPVALFVLASRERGWRLAFIALAGAAAAAGFIALFGHDVLAAVRILPSGTPFRATFGRIDFARGLNFMHLLTARRVDALVGPVFTSGPAVAAAVSWVMALVALALSWRLAGPAATRLRGVAPERVLFLIAGAAVIVFCFYAAQNVYYRAIFLILTLPGLLEMGRRRVAAVAVLLLWEAAIRAALHGFPLAGLVFWCMREGLWWVLIVELGAVLLAFVMLQAGSRRVEPALKIDGPAQNL